MKAKTVACYSCGKQRTEDDLGCCTTCSAAICGIGDCKGKCLCDHVSQLREQQAALLPAA